VSEVEEDKGVREHEEKSQKRRWKKQRWRVGRPLEGLPFFLPPHGRRQLSQRRNATTVSPPSAASLLLRQMGPRRRRVVESESMSNRPTQSSSPASPEAADHRHPCHGWPRCLDAPASSYTSKWLVAPASAHRLFPNLENHLLVFLLVLPLSHFPGHGEVGARGRCRDVVGGGSAHEAYVSRGC